MDDSQAPLAAWTGTLTPRIEGLGAAELSDLWIGSEAVLPLEVPPGLYGVEVWGGIGQAETLPARATVFVRSGEETTVTLSPAPAGRLRPVLDAPALTGLRPEDVHVVVEDASGWQTPLDWVQPFKILPEADDPQLGMLPSVLLAPGDYTLCVTGAAIVDRRQAVHLVAGEEARPRLTLQPAPGGGR